ncbi:MAG: ATP-binding cassette domain-containing protein [Mycoplasmataceae bacterium]|jgi:Fe-S cluster assembly ATP-binding protein|nr:ATP-binding cassette domain-containing protein [Mycoplasmataceae bacterium]
MITKKNILILKKVSIKIKKKKVISNISVTAKTGDVICISGPNGIGKTTLFKGIMKHFSTTIDSGEILFNDKNINNLSTDEIARLGFFYIDQNPVELPGIKLIDLLRIIHNKKNNEIFEKKINEAVKKFDFNNELLYRDINVGFSGGQKKKSEILQAYFFEPKIFLLDEIDSGLDAKAMKYVITYLNSIRNKSIILFISHNKTFSDLLKPNKTIDLSKKINE